MERAENNSKDEESLGEAKNQASLNVREFAGSLYVFRASQCLSITEYFHRQTQHKPHCCVDVAAYHELWSTGFLQRTRYPWK